MRRGQRSNEMDGAPLCYSKRFKTRSQAEKLVFSSRIRLHECFQRRRVMPQQIQQTIFYLCICEMVKKCEIQNLDTRVKGRRGGVFLPRFRIHKMERFGALPGRISSRLHAFWYKGSGMWTPKRISVYRLLKHQFSVAHRIYFLGF